MSDHLLSQLDAALRAVSGGTRAVRPTPSAEVSDLPLAPGARRESGTLMRVNHVGEVCAQALYQAQALTTRSPALREQLLAAARDEQDHLAWTEQRLAELGSRPSLLNPLWYAGAFAIGAVAGRLGDRVSLGFVVETERQVEAHLDGHLARLPAEDMRSRAIVEQMKRDEAGHGQAARAGGGVDLPAPVRWAMRAAAKVMTATAHRI
ncbi:2-polyprenyl-3-methyl-6-methoxy-1,4-benzoquinone monooxygenase [Aquabacterium sp. J223]|nr:2-polyprenyl-3-methyl-6-methoxy-1,4-benzoquinone monooxygenase [Aquabacterium sp. J223]UUX97787.1 2-polyprenyl-3-methyl-6-methoxy-1,4-benzoquinone monooxygenase [Aquabacterium sp. J223]